MNVNITEFKAKCTGLIREVSSKHKRILITKRGRVVAVVSEPPRRSGGRNPLYGKLNGTALKISEDFESDLDVKDWEATV